MAILQVRDIDDRLYSSLKNLAKSENRSLSQEVILILEKFKNLYHYPDGDKIDPDSWSDNRTAAEIIKDIKKNRRNSKRFEAPNVLFD